MPLPVGPTITKSRPRPASASSSPAPSKRELLVAAGQRGRRRTTRPRAGRRLPAGRLEPGILREDRALELVQRGAGLDPQLGEERAPRRAVGLERFGLPARAIESQHELPAQPLTQRISRHERLELRHELVVVAERELRLDQILLRPDVQLIESSNLFVCECLVGEVRQRRSPPERQRRPELLGRVDVIAGGERGPALGEQALEAVAVELVGLERERVGAGDRPDRLGW